MRHVEFQIFDYENVQILIVKTGDSVQLTLSIMIKRTKYEIIKLQKENPCSK